MPGFFFCIAFLVFIGFSSCQDLIELPKPLPELSRLKFYSAKSNLTDAALTALDAEALEIGRAPLITLNGARNWILKAIEANTTRYVAAIFAFKASDQEILKGLDYCHQSVKAAVRENHWLVRTRNAAGATKVSQVSIRANDFGASERDYYIRVEFDHDGAIATRLSFLCSVLMFLWTIWVFR